MNNLRVLITGGAGYIGSHMVRRLLKAGNAEVIVYDDLSTGHREAAGDAGFVRGNIADGALLGKVLTREKIDCVIHFAAKSLVGDSQKHPMVYYTNNVAATLSLLNTMLACNVRNIVFSSTAAVYGEPLNIPVTEEDPKEPTNVYGKTKLFIEHILEDYSQAYGLNYVSLRYFNAAGADESGEIGEDHNPETHLIPLILQHVLGKRESFELYGVDYPTKDGTCIRDFIHVNDLAEAHLLSLEALIRGEKSNVYNLGNGNGFSVKEVIEAAQKQTGKTIKVLESPRRQGDPAVLVASNKKIKEELGWSPKLASLDEIIRTAWNWHKQHPKGYNAPSPG